MLDIVWFYTKETPAIGERVRPDGSIVTVQFEYRGSWKQPDPNMEVSIRDISYHCPPRLLDEPGNTGFQVAVFSMN